MITLLCPWDLETGLPAEGDFSYRRFCLLMRQWSTSDINDDPVDAPCRGRLERARAFWAENITRGLRVSTSKKRILTLYRYSAATVWSKDDINEAETRGWRTDGLKNVDEVDLVSALADIAMQTAKAAAGCKTDSELKLEAHVQDTMTLLSGITKATLTTRRVPCIAAS